VTRTDSAFLAFRSVVVVMSTEPKSATPRKWPTMLAGRGKLVWTPAARNAVDAT